MKVSTQTYRVLSFGQHSAPECESKAFASVNALALTATPGSSLMLDPGGSGAILNRQICFEAVNGKALFRKTLFVFGNNISFKITVVKIERNVFQGKSVLGKRLD